MTMHALIDDIYAADDVDDWRAALAIDPHCAEALRVQALPTGKTKGAPTMRYGCLTR